MLSFNSSVHVSRHFSRVKFCQKFLFTIMKCIIIPKGSNCTMSLDGHNKLCALRISEVNVSSVHIIYGAQDTYTDIVLESTFYEYGPLIMTLKWYEGFTWTTYMKAEVVFVNFHFRELSNCYILLSLANLFGTFKVFRTTNFPFPTLCVVRLIIFPTNT